MREPVDDRRLRDFLEAFGRRCTSPGRLYLVGGATAVLHGFRASTADVNFVLDPEPGGAFEAIARLKNEMDVSVELSSPAHFVPELPDWRERSTFVGRFGNVDVLEYDLRAQALAKLARGFERDLHDVRAMLASGALSLSELHAAYETIRPRILRYPRLDEEELARRIAMLDAERSA